MTATLPRSLSRLSMIAVAIVALFAVSACHDGPTQSKADDGELLLLTKWVGTLFGERPVIEVVRPDGHGRRQLTAAGLAERDGAWSPDGRRIAFVRLDSSDVGTADAWPHVYVMDADGSNVRRLTSGCGRSEMPRWSPDGARIVYWGTDCGGLASPLQARLYVVNGDGSDPHPITAEGSTPGDLSPDWSPDGAWILFRARGAGSPTELFLVHPDGSGRAPFAADAAALCAGDVMTARWSPEGARVAYECYGAGAVLMVAASNGTNPVRITGPLDPDVPFAGDFDAVWSPDGRQIAITREDETHGWQLFVSAAGPAGASVTARGPVITDLASFRVTSWRGRLQ